MHKATNVLVAYYSSTGNVLDLAEAVVGAEKAGAEVRPPVRVADRADEAVHRPDAWHVVPTRAREHGTSHVAQDDVAPSDTTLRSAEHLGYRVAAFAAATHLLRVG